MRMPSRFRRGLSLGAAIGLAMLTVATPPGWRLPADEPALPIVGGDVAEPGEFPWIAALVERGSASPFSGYRCGGALIHPQWVVTAAHCVFGSEPSELDVFVGSQDLTDPSAGERIAVADIVMHPQYNRYVLDSDIALLLLARPVGKVNAFLPINADPLLEVPGTIATALGWGTTISSTYSPTTDLHRVDLPVVSNGTAESVYGFGITGNMIFAGYAQGGRSSCWGDSGGPLVTQDAGGRWILIGITSFGRGGLECDDPNNYGGNTRVSRFRDWIHRHVAPNQLAWETRHGTSATAPQDSDGDSLSAWQEFSLQTDPAVNSSHDLPEIRVLEIDGKSFPALEFRRLAGNSEIDYVVEHTGTLGNWEALDPELLRVGEPVPVDGEPGVTVDLIRAPDPLPAGGAMRLRTQAARRYVPGLRELFVPGSLFGGLSASEPVTTDPPGRHYQLFELVGAEPGVMINITLRSTDFDASLAVLDAETGALIADDANDSGGDTDDRVSLVPEAGVGYHVRVSSEDEGGTGDYLLSAFEPAPGIPLPVPGSETDSLTRADAADPSRLPTIFYMDEYSPTGVAPGAWVTVRAGSTLIDAVLMIVNAESGEVLEVDDDSGGGLSGLESYLTFQVPENFPVLIRVTTYGIEDRGAYTVTTGLLPTIGVPATITGSLASRDPLDPNSFFGRYYRDDYLLTGATPGQSIKVTMSAGFIDSALYVIDADTEAILARATSQPNRQPETLTFTVQDGVNYIIRASSEVDRDTGSYTLETELTP